MYPQQFFLESLVKAKWKNLKDKFRIEMKSLPKCRSGSEAQEYKGKWPFFNMMQFIKGIIAPTATQGNLSAPVNPVSNSDVEDTYLDNDVTHPDASLMQDSITTKFQTSNATYTRPSTQTTNCSTNSEKSTKKKRTDQSEIDRYIGIEQQKLELLRNDQNRSSELVQNPDYNFLMSLLPYFGEFDGIEKLKLRTSVQNLVMEALKRKKQGVSLNHVQVYSINVPVSTNNGTSDSTVGNYEQSTTYLLDSFDET